MDSATPARPSPPLPPVTVSTLIGHRDVSMGARCLASFVRCSADSLQFEIHEDGTLTPEDRGQLEAEIPVWRFVDRREADEQMQEQLKDHPACLAYRSRHVLGLKLFDVPLLSEREEVAFSDSDIFFFRPFRNLFAWPDAKTGCLFMQDWQDAYALRPWHLPAVMMPRRLNSGLFWVRRRRYDLDFLESLLARNLGVFSRLEPWLEQTCWAALAARIDGQLWSRRQIRAIENEGSLDQDLVAGHFTSSVRGLLSRASEMTHLERPAEPMAVEPMQRLHVHQLLAQQLARRLRRPARSRGATSAG